MLPAGWEVTIFSGHGRPGGSRGNLSKGNEALAKPQAPHDETRRLGASRKQFVFVCVAGNENVHFVHTILHHYFLTLSLIFFSISLAVSLSGSSFRAFL